jgi:DNA ligase (NAD+)
VSKDAMDIKSFGEANVRKFFDMGLLKTIPDIYSFEVEKLSGIEGFGTKSILNLKAAIEASKSQPLHRFIYALGIRYVGETTAKALAQKVSDIFEFEKMTEEALKLMDDVGVKVAKSIFDFFSDVDNIALLQKLNELGVKTKHEKQESITGMLTGQTFLFTGTLSKLKRNEAEALVEQNGGKILSGVSSKLNYLITGEDAGSKLEKAKKIPGIKIMSEEEFLSMLPE